MEELPCEYKRNGSSSKTVLSNCCNSKRILKLYTKYQQSYSAFIDKEN